MSDIQITATYVGAGQQPLVSLLEVCLDMEHVTLTRSQYEIKSIIPLDLVIEVVTGFALQKYVLEPLTKEWSGKWKIFARRHFQTHPAEAVNVTIKITKENFVCEAISNTRSQDVAEVWDNMQKVRSILELESLLPQISAVRFKSDADGELLIVCYDQDKPVRIVNLEKNVTTEIPSDQTDISIHGKLTPEEWYQKQIHIRDAHEKDVEEAQQLLNKAGE